MLIHCPPKFLEENEEKIYDWTARAALSVILSIYAQACHAHKKEHPEDTRGVPLEYKIDEKGNPLVLLTEQENNKLLDVLTKRIDVIFPDFLDRVSSYCEAQIPTMRDAGYKEENSLIVATKYFCNNFGGRIGAEICADKDFYSLIDLIYTFFGIKKSQSKRDMVCVDNSLLYYGVRSAIESGKDYFTIPDGADWPLRRISKKSVSAVAELRPEPSVRATNELKEKMQKEVMKLDDLCADVFDIISSSWIDSNPASYESSMLIHVDDMLRMRGVSPNKNKKGSGCGFRKHQRDEVNERIRALDNLWITVFSMPTFEEQEMKSGRKRRVQATWAGLSRAVVVSSLVGQTQLDGTVDPFSWRVRPGDVFSKFFLGPGRQTALLSRKALAYNYERERHEKRLARYFAWQWRIRASEGNYFQPFPVKLLMSAVDEKLLEQPKANPTRERNRLEKALDRLEQDGVIRAWQYQAEDFDPELGARGSKWWSDWLEWRILIEAPQDLQDHYASIEGASRVIDVAPAKPAPSPALNVRELGEQLKRARTERNLTQLQAAEQMGITQPLLSALENLKYARSLRKSTITKIETWLDAKI